MKRQAEIAAALERHGLGLDAAQALDAILQALAREPDPHTSVDPLEAVDVHVADSLAGLAVEPLRDARTIADVGAGAGFPGLVLAAVLAHARVDLVEAARRKAAVIERLIAAGGLGNARAVAERAEDWGRARRGGYDAVTVRAVAPLAVLAEYAAPLLAPGGVLVAWKGRRDPDEEADGAAAAAEVGLRRAEVLPVTPYPGSRNRHLHVYTKDGETPARFPRRPGMASKRPLGRSPGRPGEDPCKPPSDRNPS
ncbi:MAG TPA: 16S rRNA (guanine(527)-N(7))-methyltransferase RsmG [Thermoleophilaceae bacterium]